MYIKLFLPFLLSFFLLEEIPAQNKHFITFYAKDYSITNPSPGHAFVSYVREDDNLKMTVVDGVWGFYPVTSPSAIKSYFIGEVSGQIRNDFSTQRDIGYTVQVSKNEYEKAISIKEKWASFNYELTKQDCISFAEEVAQSLSHKIHTPERASFDLPHDYIRILKLLNSEQIVCPSHLDIVDQYDKNDLNYHMYTHVTEICDSIDNSCCSEKFVFDIMKSKANLTAPYAGDKAVVNCGQVDLFGFGSIVTVMDKNPYSITNYTKENHELHKGKVIRYVVKVGSKIYVYTVGIGVNKNKFIAWINANSLSVSILWGSVNKKLKEEVEKSFNLLCSNKSSTLFLFDLSGSMNDNGGGTIPKVEQAKNASKQTLDALRSNGQGVTNEVAVYGFSGGCVPDPTIEISSFDTDLTAVEQRINTMRAGGGTPLSNALRAAECKMAAHLIQQGQQKGKLIILSDGQGSCGNIRPPGVYNSAPLQRNRSIMVDATQCGFSGGSTAAVSYYTVGFNIPPGSPAERDLQYLSQSSGGKYLNVQNQMQLTRAFRKFNRTYQPKESPALSGLPSNSTSDFSKGVSKIKEEYFDDALKLYKKFKVDHPDDCHGAYNIALSLEAEDFYKEAIKNYQQYLILCPSASDRIFVEKQITFLEEEFREFVLFQKEVVRSDLEFLKLHFQRIQNGQSVLLAEEFKGFLQEKSDYYEKLPRLIASENRMLENLSKEIAAAFKQCKKLIRRSSKTWDQDAIPLISMTYLNLEELLEEM